MSVVHKIVVVTHKAGRGTQTVISECCQFKKGGNICTLEHIECRYGLTEIVVPEPVCPLMGGVTLEINIEVEETEA